MQPEASFARVSADVERQYLRALFEACGGDLARMAQRAARARAAPRARFTCASTSWACACATCEKPRDARGDVPLLALLLLAAPDAGAPDAAPSAADAGAAVRGGTGTTPPASARPRAPSTNRRWSG